MTFPAEYSFVQTFDITTGAGKFIVANIESIPRAYGEKYQLKLKITKDKFDHRKDIINYIYTTKDRQRIVPYSKDLEENVTISRVYFIWKSDGEPNYLGCMVLYKLGNSDASIHYACPVIFMG